MNKKTAMVGALSLAALAACSGKKEPEGQLIRWLHLNAPGETKALGEMIDTAEHTDGVASYKITSDKPSLKMIGIWSDLDIANSKLVCQAQAKTKNIMGGSIFLEATTEHGTYQGLPGIRGTVPRWSPLQVIIDNTGKPNPKSIAMKLMFNAKGIAWLDQLKCWKQPAA